jgi:hypothetical protein
VAAADHDRVVGVHHRSSPILLPRGSRL